MEIDGHNVKDLNVEFLRKTVGVVSQEPVLFDGTLESNIRMGNDDVTTEQVIDAAKQVLFYSHVLSFVFSGELMRRTLFVGEKLQVVSVTE